MTTLVIGFALGILSMAVKSWWADRLSDGRTKRRIARALIPELQEIGYSIWGLGDPIKWIPSSSRHTTGGTTEMH